MKKSVFLLMAGFIFLQGCVRAQGKLMEEILSAKPKRFDNDVTPIVLRYFPLGKDRQAVISELTAQGFEIEEAKEKIGGCAECDPLVILGRHTRTGGPLPYFHPSSDTTISFVFKKGKVVNVSGNHFQDYI